VAVLAWKVLVHDQHIHRHGSGQADPINCLVYYLARAC